MNKRAYPQLILLLIYCMVVFFVNASAIVCVNEEGHVQIEFGAIACDAGAPLNENKDCGNCEDSKPATGETHRIAWGSSFNLPQFQNVIFCQFFEQQPSQTFFHIESRSAADGLVGSSILII